MYDFEGKIEMNGKQYKLDMKNFLQKGSKLHNSVKVDLLVIYTGIHTKLVMNMGAPRLKKSRGKKLLELMAIIYFFISVGLAIFLLVMGV